MSISISWRSSLVLPLLLPLLLLVSSSIRCAGAVQTSKLQVLIPQDLRKKGEGYDHRDALFGIPPYGGSIQQQVFYADSTLCSTGSGSGADDIKKGGYPQRSDGSAWKTPFILMVDRGECTFVQKVRNAQRLGASAVLVADIMCMCDRPDCDAEADGGAGFCESEEPIMADDGSGSDISIPSFLVFKEDADEIKKVLMDNVQVRIQMSFKVPAPDSRVEYDLWTHPSDRNSRPIEKSWGVAALALAEHASFSPHLYIYDGLRAGCQDDQGHNLCFNLCTNQGRYCSTDPDDDLDAGATGADVVVESLRRICIWNLYGKKDGVGQQWWAYVDYFIEHCDPFVDNDYSSMAVASKFNDPVCVQNAMDSAGIEVQKINDCMANSGELADLSNATNSLLEKEIADQQASGVILIPSLVVNKAVIRGSLSFSTVLKAVCSGFVAGSEPLICQECANCQDELACVTNNGFCAAKHGAFQIVNGSVPVQLFGVAIAALVFVFCCVATIQHRRQQMYMQDQIRGIVQEYMPVTSQTGANDTSMGLPQDDPDDDDDGHGNGGASAFSIT
eukprot:CAMPEP_0198140070 /NCGR_PEP_ID=MMETSP1443-20131203/3277_1 /TAXON_ID=186043 /ORGANISM="Entomoneis sp., Strain CCMP2396" /LENGTH=559 /DNA_ID=CAMNT_0043802381 /DNA_START=129 /DNA_END=1808 /DNA_ORIENTATION=-